MQWSEGTVPMLFTASPRTTKIAGLLAGNELDIKPITNIPSFVICRKLTQMAGGSTPCIPARLRHGKIPIKQRLAAAKPY